MGHMGYPELSVRNYHCLPHNNPDECSSLKRTAVYSVYAVNTVSHHTMCTVQ